MNTISQHILSVVETKREQLGMSKAELARRMDINPVTLGTMLRGTRAMYADEEKNSAPTSTSHRRNS